MNPKVEFYFKKGEWQEELLAMRRIVLGLGLDEELKWGTPCYTLNGANIVLLHVFKEYCAMLFFKGALMADPEGILVQQTKNVQLPRQLRFTSLGEIELKAAAIRAYIKEAIRVERAGLRMEKSERPAPELPGEFQVFLDGDADLKAAFEALTPGRQRAYGLYFSAPKQSRTRTARVEKLIPKILDGKGLDD